MIIFLLLWQAAMGKTKYPRHCVNRRGSQLIYMSLRTCGAKPLKVRNKRKFSLAGAYTSMHLYCRTAGTSYARIKNCISKRSFNRILFSQSPYLHYLHHLSRCFNDGFAVRLLNFLQKNMQCLSRFPQFSVV